MIQKEFDFILAYASKVYPTLRACLD